MVTMADNESRNSVQAKLLHGLATLAVFCALGYYAVTFIDRTDTRDLSIYLDAAARLRAGEPLYDVRYTFAESGAEFELQYLYPPALAALLALALAVLSPDSLATLWQFGQPIAILISSFLIAQLVRTVQALRAPQISTRLSNATPSTAVLFCALALWPPTLDGILWGQVNSYILLLLCTALCATACGSARIAGAALGIAAALKATPLLLALPLLLHRRVYSLVWAVLAGAAAHIPLLLYPLGITAIPDFINASAAISAGNVVNDPHYEYSIRRVLSLIWSPSVQWVTPLAACVLCVYGAALLYSRWVCRTAVSIPSGSNGTQRAAALCALEMTAGIGAMLLVSPLLWFHHLIWLFPLVAMISAASTTRSKAIMGRLIYLTLAPLLYVHIAARNSFQMNDWVFKSLPVACICASAALMWRLITDLFYRQSAPSDTRRVDGASH